MRTAGWIGVLALALVLPLPARAQVTRPTPDDFRSRFNAALGNQTLKMRLRAWKADAPGSLSVTALVTPDIRAFAQLDHTRRISSVLMLMQTTGTIESIAQSIAAVAATTYAANPELPEEDRELLFGELGLYDQGWGVRGLDGIAFREGRTYRVIHPGGDTLLIALVCWGPDAQPVNPYAF